MRVREEDVVRLDVAVDDASGMRSAQGLAALREELNGLLQRHGATPLYPCAQGLAVKQLHRDVGRAVVERAVIEDLDDVPRPELRGRFRLCIEAPEGLLRAHEFLRNKLDGDCLTQPEVSRRPDRTHPALSNERIEPVSAGHDRSRPDERGCRTAHPACTSLLHAKRTGPSSACQGQPMASFKAPEDPIEPPAGC